jgi:multicomponent Na+:H+ antiporter subunit D
VNPVLLPILIPFLTALVGVLTPRNPRAQGIVALVGALANLAAAAWLIQQVITLDVLVLRAGEWVAPFGITLVVDRLSAAMVAVSAVICLATVIYSFASIEARRIELFYYPLLNFLMLGVNGAFLTADLFNLYVWFEVMLISSFVLIALGNEKAQLEGALKYVALNLVSSMLFLSAAGTIYGKMGTLNFADLAMLLHGGGVNDILVNSSAIVLLVSFSIKAGAFPFFFWLPASYHTPPVAVSAIFAGLLTKVGVYALFRVYVVVFSELSTTIQPLLLFIAGATMVTGVLGAAAHYEIRRILSFHIISQIGYMLLGLALLTQAAIAAGIFYIVHHIIVKANLFLIGGIIGHIKGTTELKQIGGLYRTAPLLGVLFLIPALSLGGIPPLSGFWAKFGLIKGALEIEAFLMVIIALLVGIWTLFSMTKIWGEAFWKAQPEDSSAANYQPTSPGVPVSLWLPCVGLAVMTLFIGFWAEPFFEFSMVAAEQLVSPQGYLDAILNHPLPDPKLK